MFTFSAASAAATLAVNPVLSGNVAVISFAGLAVNAGTADTFAAGITAAFFTFFATLAMACLLKMYSCHPGTTGGKNYLTDRLPTALNIHNLLYHEGAEQAQGHSRHMHHTLAFFYLPMLSA